MSDMRETVAFSGHMLVGAVIPRSGDAGYLMLDIQECTWNEIQKHPGSRNQYPGSVNTCNGFHRNGQV
jgi:hypothetical protein